MHMGQPSEINLQRSLSGSPLPRLSVVGRSQLQGTRYNLLPPTPYEQLLSRAVALVLFSSENAYFFVHTVPCLFLLRRDDDDQTRPKIRVGSDRPPVRKVSRIVRREHVGFSTGCIGRRPKVELGTSDSLGHPGVDGIPVGS